MLRLFNGLLSILAIASALPASAQVLRGVSLEDTASAAVQHLGGAGCHTLKTFPSNARRQFVVTAPECAQEQDELLVQLCDGRVNFLAENVGTSVRDFAALVQTTTQARGTPTFDVVTRQDAQRQISLVAVSWRLGSGVEQIELSQVDDQPPDIFHSLSSLDAWEANRTGQPYCEPH